MLNFLLKECFLLTNHCHPIYQNKTVRNPKLDQKNNKETKTSNIYGLLNIFITRIETMIRKNLRKYQLKISICGDFKRNEEHLFFKNDYNKLLLVVKLG